MFQFILVFLQIPFKQIELIPTSVPVGSRGHLGREFNKL